MRLGHAKKIAFSDLDYPLSAKEAYELCNLIGKYRARYPRRAKTILAETALAQQRLIAKHFDGDPSTFDVETSYMLARAKLFTVIITAANRATSLKELEILYSYAFSHFFHCKHDEDVWEAIAKRKAVLA